MIFITSKLQVRRFKILGIQFDSFD